jgi:hypothetical protein
MDRVCSAYILSRLDSQTISIFQAHFNKNANADRNGFMCVVGRYRFFMPWYPNKFPHGHHEHYRTVNVGSDDQRAAFLLQSMGDSAEIFYIAPDSLVPYYICHE